VACSELSIFTRQESLITIVRYLLSWSGHAILPPRERTVPESGYGGRHGTGVDRLRQDFQSDPAAGAVMTVASGSRGAPTPAPSW